jgi:hypothetical protein
MPGLKMTMWGPEKGMGSAGGPWVPTPHGHRQCVAEQTELTPQVGTPSLPEWYFKCILFPVLGRS